MAKGVKTGGRVAGTPNKASRDLKAFLGRVFAKAFADPGFEIELVLQITTLKIDPNLLKTLLAYFAGQPTKQVAVTHKGTVTLAQLITGDVPDDVLGEGDDDEALDMVPATSLLPPASSEPGE